jgi:hypothetical protein
MDAVVEWLIKPLASGITMDAVVEWLIKPLGSDAM